MEIGSKIRNLRLKKGLTQEELGDRCELSKAFISLLESDKTSPSMATLEDILNALGTDFAHFFKEEPNKRVVYGREDFSVKQDTDLKNEICWLIPNAQKNEMEPILVEIRPGEDSQLMQPHEGEEFGYVLNGRVILVNGKEEYPIKKGGTFYIKGDYEHFLKNTGSHSAQVLWICTPPVF